MPQNAQEVGGVTGFPRAMAVLSVLAIGFSEAQLFALQPTAPVQPMAGPVQPMAAVNPYATAGYPSVGLYRGCKCKGFTLYIYFRPVLGCIDASDSKSSLILQHFRDLSNLHASFGRKEPRLKMK